jgi:hypothetical protein
MAMTWDLSDVPTVDCGDLAAAMRALIADERGLVLLRGLTEADMDTVHETLKRRFDGEPQQSLAAFVRFRHMVEVFSARRLKELLLDRGLALMAAAIAIAASQRLNANRGFNPQVFLMSLHDAVSDNVVELAPANDDRALEPAHQLAA